MKLNVTPRASIKDPDLQRELRNHATQVNMLTEGRLSATYNAQTAAPTTGTYQIGDFVRNSAPQVLGTAGSQYVIYGWMNLSGGFVQCRFLTGT